MKQNIINKWYGHQFETGLEDGPGDDFKRFAREMKADLKKKAATVGYEMVSFKKLYYEFSAVLRNATADKYVYLSIPDVRFFPDKWCSHVLCRTMKNDHDWTGEDNHYCPWNEIPVEISRLVGQQSAYAGQKGGCQ